MKRFISVFFIFLTLGLISCSQRDDIVQVGENTFVFKHKVYTIIDKKILLLGDLVKDSINQIQIYKSNIFGKTSFSNQYCTEIEFPKQSLDFIKGGASSKFAFEYRGNEVYFRLSLYGMEDLKENFNSGSFTLNLIDNFKFVLFSIEIPTNEFIGVLASDDKSIDYYRYNGSIETNNEVFQSIYNYNLSSTVKLKR